MSKNKSKAKAQRREMAAKKAKRKTILIVSIIAVIVIAIIAIGIISATSQNNTAVTQNEETFTHGRSSVRLLADGTFFASLPHGVQKNGTYTKTDEGARTIVSFNVNGRAERGLIENNALHIPHEWDDGHGHGSVFRRSE